MILFAIMSMGYKLISAKVYEAAFALGDLMKADDRSGPRLNIKTVLSAYGVFHVKDKTAVRTSYL